jgi:hypothetical protein
MTQPSERPPFLWYNSFSRQFRPTFPKIRKRRRPRSRSYRAATSAIGVIGRDGGPILTQPFQRSRSANLPRRDSLQPHSLR